MQPRTVLLMYLPGLHQASIEFMEKHRERARELYILGSELLAEFPILQREIRAFRDPGIAKRLIQGLGYFDRVETANHNTLRELKDARVIMSDEQISDEVRERYLQGVEVEQVSIFLRYDEKYVKASHGEVSHIGAVSQDDLHRYLMKNALKAAGKSADWFRQVGAVLVLNDVQTSSACNQRMPTAQDYWLVGDPRMYLPYGEKTERRTVLHAEQAVIARAARDGIGIKGASLYVTTFPCSDCCNVIVEAGIIRCYYQTGYADLGSNDVFVANGVEVIKVVP